LLSRFVDFERKIHSGPLSRESGSYCGQTDEREFSDLVAATTAWHKHVCYYLFVFCLGFFGLKVFL